MRSSAPIAGLTIGVVVALLACMFRSATSSLCTDILEVVDLGIWSCCDEFAAESKSTWYLGESTLGWAKGASVESFRSLESFGNFVRRAGFPFERVVEGSGGISGVDVTLVEALCGGLVTGFDVILMLGKDVGRLLALGLSGTLALSSVVER